MRIPEFIVPLSRNAVRMEIPSSSDDEHLFTWETGVHDLNPDETRVIVRTGATWYEAARVSNHADAEIPPYEHAEQLTVKTLGGFGEVLPLAA